MIIEFGRWQLRPVDKNNWALNTAEAWEKKAASARKNKTSKTGVMVPDKTTRYFQWPNIGYAIHYAATRDLADKEGTATPWEAAEEFTNISKALLAEFCAALDKYTDPTKQSAHIDARSAE
jgi:hypothetical protein